MLDRRFWGELRSLVKEATKTLKHLNAILEKVREEEGIQND